MPSLPSLARAAVPALPRPWRASPLGEHMERIDGSRGDLLPLFTRPELEPATFFESPEPEDPPRPFYIEQRVWKYTPPPRKPEGDLEPWEEADRWYPSLHTDGADLAELLADDDEPRILLLTGHTGTGKTLLTRRFFRRILGGEGWAVGPRTQHLDTLFVRIEGRHLPPSADLQGAGLLRKLVAERLFEGKVETPDPARHVDSLGRLFASGPRIVLVLDLNRGNAEVAKRAIEACRAVRGTGGSKLRFLVLYRPQSALLDRDVVWREVDPVKHKDDVLGLELRNVDRDPAFVYFEHVREARWRRVKEIAPNAPTPEVVRGCVETEKERFEELLGKYEEFVGRPILLNFATEVEDAAEVRGLGDLYWQVIDQYFERNPPADASAGDLFLWTAAATLRMVEHRSSASATAQDQGLILPRPQQRTIWESPIPRGVSSAWREHFDHSALRDPDFATVDGETRRARLRRAQDHLVEHGLLQRDGEKTLRFFHDSLGYFFAAWVLRFASAGPVEREDEWPRLEEDERRRIGAILRADPVFWYLRVEFLGEWLDVEDLHALVFEELLGAPEMAEPASPQNENPRDEERELGMRQFLIQLLASRLVSSLADEPPPEETAELTTKRDALLRLRFAVPAPERIQADWGVLSGHYFELLQRDQPESPDRVWTVETPAWEAEDPRAYVSESGELRRLGENAQGYEEWWDPRTGREPRVTRDDDGRILENRLHDDTAVIYVALPGGALTLGSPADERGRYWRTETDPATGAERLESDEDLRRATVGARLVAKYPTTHSQRACLAELARSRFEARPESFVEQLRCQFLEGWRGHDVAPAASAETLRKASAEEFSVWLGEVDEEGVGTVSAVVRGEPIVRRFRGGGTLPAEAISWYEAVLLAWAMDARLPTEAEWEYACRGPGSPSGPYFPADTALSEIARFLGNSELRTWPVGGKLPNGFGLHDLHGNVSEWCADAYDGTYFRVARGGVSYGRAGNLRAAYRFRSNPGRRVGDLGFRAVRSPSDAWPLGPSASGGAG